MTIVRFFNDGNARDANVAVVVDYDDDVVVDVDDDGVVDVDDDDYLRNTNLIFETHNCATATPATISR